ncbi:MAG: OB-fold domain-containing protein [Bryobacteraceae bacterium]
MTGTVYTETIVFAPPSQFVDEAPYQIAIVSLDGGGRRTVRIDGDRVAIGDTVSRVEDRAGMPIFKKA